MAEVVADGAHWKRKLEEPATSALSHSGPLAPMVDGDAPTAPRAPPPPTRAQASRAALPPPRPPTKERGERQHIVDGDGRLTHNRKGKKLCSAFQSGHCAGDSIVCPKDKKSMHQCNKCLQPGHGGDGCGVKAAQPPKPRPASRGKGGKAGKGRGPS